MKQKLYLDTSILSAYYDDEKPERQKITQMWWKNEMQGYEVLLSRVTVDELEATKNIDKRNNFLGLVENIKILPLTQECGALAKKYLQNDIMPEDCFNDALHIAISTINKIEVLVSWNFEHLVNTNTRHKVNGVNLLNNYQEIEIVSPLEIGGGKYV